MSGFVTRKAQLACTCAVFALSLADTAQAELSAADVWADFKGYMAGSGYQVEAQETQSGDTLTVNELKLSIPVSEEGGTIAIELGSMSFIGNSDGSVNITFPEVLPMTVFIAPPEADEDEVKVNLEYFSTGLLMTATGDPNDLTYNYTAAELIMKMNDLEVNGAAVDLGEIEVGMSDLAGATTMKVGEQRATEQQIVAEQVNYVFDIVDPEGGGAIVAKGKIGGLNGTGSATMPLEIDATNMALALADGFDVNAQMTFRDSNGNFQFEEEGETVKVESSSQGGTFDVAMSSGGISYGASSSGAKVFMQGGEIPFPVEFAMQEAGFNLTMPISQSDEIQDFAFVMKLGGFTMSDLLWALFDAGAQLPRDPATLALDLSGKAKLLFDIMDPEQMAGVEQSGDLPGELNSLNINDLQVSIAGAELLGKGEFTFNNEDLETFDGFPAPEGAVDLSLVGGNGLLDKLVAMGLVPQEQATGVRLMLGLFAVPGTTEDSLTSKIEVRSDGQVLANGQRLR
ncbi:MAG: DUF2125 domain-containing protein [Pseudomonadota bacterium]